MSTSVTGRLVDGTDTGIDGLHVVVKDDSGAFDTELGHADTTGGGNFSITIPDDTSDNASGARKLGVYVTTQGGREVNTSQHDDDTGSTLALGDIHLRTADVRGWTVSLLGSPNALDVRAGNAVLPLTDDEEAWGHVKDQIGGAGSSVNVMQLQLDVPKKFDATPANEGPEIVLEFGSPIDPVAPRQLDANDFRLERMLLNAATNHAVVRVMISKNVIPIPVIVGGIVLLPLELLALLILWVFDVGPTRSLVSLATDHFFGGGPAGGESDVAKYFKDGNSTTKVAPFKTSMFFVVHAKAVITDDNHATLLGSPFSQSYWDTHDHAIFEPRRGSAAGEPIPVHDVSMSARGPIVQDVHDAFRLHWNKDAATADQVAAIGAVAAATPTGDESAASVQLVRTINRGIFDAMPDGEKGVLEAYLRAIDSAQTYIYFENQYFTNEAIGTALTAALNDTTRPNLQIIAMVNVIPDMPFYPRWQASLIDRIRSGAGTTNATRFSVFTAWTHNAPVPSRHQNKPMLMPNYLHTKTAVVDGTWATVGSANLDGASLDYFQILHGIQGGDNRNHELNYVIYNGVEGAATTDAIDKLRLKLWSEHLGIAATDTRLATGNSAGFLALWKQVAEAKRAALQADPTQINPALGRVLEYPAGTTSGYGRAPYVDFLTKAHVDLTKVDLLDKTTPFVFKTGTWKT